MTYIVSGVALNSTHSLTWMLAVTGMLTGFTNCDGMRMHSHAVDDNQRLSSCESTQDDRVLHLTHTQTIIVAYHYVPTHLRNTTSTFFLNNANLHIATEIIIIIIIIRNLYSAIMPLGGYRGAERYTTIDRNHLDSWAIVILLTECCLQVAVLIRNMQLSVFHSVNKRITYDDNDDNNKVIYTAQIRQGRKWWSDSSDRYLVHNLLLATSIWCLSPVSTQTRGDWSGILQWPPATLTGIYLVGNSSLKVVCTLIWHMRWHKWGATRYVQTTLDFWTEESQITADNPFGFPV